MIKAEGLTKRYGAVTAVENLSFDVRDGAVTGFLGPNGAGKSTTIKMMLGLARPDAGTATFDGRRFVDLDRPGREIGVSLDPHQFHSGRSARNHLRVLGAIDGIGNDRVDAVLERVGLSADARRHVGGYSLGMRQRLGLAAALLGDPKTLILDEPANGLDPAGISWLRQTLRELAGEGRTVFVSSHQLAEMSRTADDLVVIAKGGRLVRQGSMNDVLASGSKQTVIVRTPQAGALTDALVAKGAGVDTRDDGSLAITGITADRIGDLAAQLGVALHEVSTQTESLEDVFLELTGDDAPPVPTSAVAPSTDAPTRATSAPTAKGALR